MFVFQADRISEYEEEKARILRDIITSQVQKNYSEIQEYYGLEDDVRDDQDSVLRGKPVTRTPDNPYLVDLRKNTVKDPPQRRRKNDPASPMRGKY